ncbi:MAG: RNA methyltransferase [Myxococcaceae bacterium]
MRTQLCVVLHESQGSENVGAVARLLANFGFSRLVLSKPQELDWNIVQQRAVGAESILDGRKVVGGLDEALAGVRYVLGTSFREQSGAKRALTPLEGAKRLAERAMYGPVALVFGGERRGLSDVELMQCNDFVRIETFEPQPSMNLAQAAAVMLYLCAMVAAPAATEAPARAPASEPASEPARRETWLALHEAMLASLMQSGFLNPQSPEAALQEVLETLRRADPTQRELELWTGLWKQVRRALGSTAR